MDQQEQTNQELTRLKARLFDLQEENTQLNQILGHIAQKLGAQTIEDLVKKAEEASEKMQQESPEEPSGE